MTTNDLIDFLEENNDSDFCKFEKIKNPLFKQSDLQALFIFNQILPEHGDFICSTNHYGIFFSVSPKDISKKASKEQILDLLRCGISYDSSRGCFYKFI